MEQRDLKKIYPEWEAVKKLGEGSYGAVYEIKRVGPFETAVAHSALKVISIPKTDSDLESIKNEIGDDHTVTAMLRSQVEDIIREFQCMSHLKGHTNIVSYEDHKVVQQDNGMGWDVLIRMELLTPLLVHCKSGALSEGEVVRLGIDMCRALEICQRFNIIHRDIKPQNIFLNDVGDFKLGDFGVAKTMEHTFNASIAGTHSYMAPEVYRGQPYNHTVDTYSLGLVLYWLLNEKRLPFEPLPPAQLLFQTREDALKRRMNGEPIPAPAHGSPALKAIVQKACAYDAQKRYQNAAQMRQALEQLQGPKGISTPTSISRQVLDLDCTRCDTWEKETLTDVKKQAVKTHLYDTLEADTATAVNGTDEKKRSTVRALEATATESQRSKSVPNSAPPQNEAALQKPRSAHTGYWGIAVMILVVAVAVAFVVFFRSPKDNQAEPLPSTAETTIQTQPVSKTTETVHQHDWQPATCLKPQTCVSCGETSGEPLSHEWQAATLDAPETCRLCGMTRGMTLRMQIGTSPTKSLASGGNHTVGLRADGTVVATGKSTYGQCSIEEWQDIIAVAAGENHTVGLKTNGSVVATAYNKYGQCNVAEWVDIAAIAAGYGHTVGLKRDGTVIATGWNYYDQCDVREWTDIVAIAAGSQHTVGLKSDGTVIATGNYSDGQCNVGEWADVVAIAAGRHTVGLKSDGTVVATGSNRHGQCNLYQWSNIVAIAAGNDHTVGLKSDGTVIAVGDNGFGQCDVDGWTNIVAIAAAQNCTVGLKTNGTVVAAGRNEFGQCNVQNWKLCISE